jgi:hypothetical protein
MQFAENVQVSWQEGVLLRHDNARPHTARATQERIQELQWELLEYLLYNPYLASSDFHLFGRLKNHLGGKSFADDEEVETEMLRQQPKYFYAARFDALVKRWDKCISVVEDIARNKSFFRVRISHVLYPFVTYLLTFPLSYI